MSAWPFVGGAVSVSTSVRSSSYRLSNLPVSPAICICCYEMSTVFVAVCDCRLVISLYDDSVYHAPTPAVTFLICGRLLFGGSMNPSSGCGVHCPLVYLSTCPSDGGTVVVSTSVRSFSYKLSILVLRSIIGCYVLMSMV